VKATSILLAVGIALLAAAAVLGFSTVHANGESCGAALGSANSAGSDCSDARSTRSELTLAVGAPGLVLVLIGAVAGSVEYTREVPPTQKNPAPRPGTGTEGRELGAPDVTARSGSRRVAGRDAQRGRQARRG